MSELTAIAGVGASRLVTQYFVKAGSDGEYAGMLREVMAQRIAMQQRSSDDERSNETMIPQNTYAVPVGERNRYIAGVKSRLDVRG